ncbi:heavy metal transporter [Acetobacter sp. LMG 1636]|uniref:Heavy metal transporter n=2 Tax=Acetobacter fallax TaxID=1737473 RepID=A0ABX0K7F9_9PROT|nr:heavy metal transporter [Acetobacter fallax]NHO35292.1 heavy metal transporter [Acetobacter fallax]
MKTETFLVQGMTCDGCVASIRRALEGIAGVKEARPSLEKGEVTVDYDPSLTGETALRRTIEAAGFDVN